MAADDKTEPATPRKRSEARKRGQVAKSTDLSSMTVMLGLLVFLHAMLGSTVEILRLYMQSTFRHLDHTEVSHGTLVTHASSLVMTLFRSIGPLVLLAMAVGITVNVAQTGPMISSERLKPDFNRLNPIKGASRFFSPMSLFELAKSLFKIGVIGYVCYSSVSAAYPKLLMLSRIGLMQSIGLMLEITYQMALRVVVTMLVMGAVDFFYQRYTLEKSLRMTKQEVRDEMKQQEGNPQIKQRIRQRMRQIARKRMMQEVPKADVVVTNPTHFAVALKYDARQSPAPIVIAKGQDLLALKIRELAQEHDIPIVQNPPLARALYDQTPLGKEIPTDLYEAVAEVLAFVYQINSRRKDRGSARQ